MGEIKKILWFVSTPEDVKFLKVFAEHAYVAIDVFHINFITRCMAAGLPGEQLLPRFTQPVARQSLDCCFNVLSGRLSLATAEKAYAATFQTVRQYLQRTQGPVLFVIPSGRLVHHIAASDLAQAHSIRCLYINYSNFPGYTFFDRKGTDCLSAVYQQPQMLEHIEGFVESAETVQSTFEHFRRLKAEQKKIPQVKAGAVKAMIKALAFVADTLAQHLTNVYGDRRVTFRRSRSAKAAAKAISGAVEPALPQAFVFFPLQVSTDQQVLVNYRGHSIFKAIDEAIALAQGKGRVLVTREHPAEARGAEVRAYIEQCRAEGSAIVISRRPVHELIRLAEQVVTINSTVGLEAILNDKAVHFLGDSLYAKVTRAQLASYLNNYLIKVDYHSGAGMSAGIAAQILARAGHDTDCTQS
ncbi:MAG: hypothetical protein PW845_21480 [Pseudomonas sp.]|nr:hypothetical protein [Pseudomonas sp.]